MDRQMAKLVSLAYSFRQLRELEMGDARRYRMMRERCQNEEAKGLLARRVTNIVRDARKWNRQLVKAETAIRAAMTVRRAQAVFVQNFWRDREAASRRLATLAHHRTSNARH